jgi:rsbT co-antagonist protein RsbR
MCDPENYNLKGDTIMAATNIYTEMAEVLKKNQQEIVKLWVTQINAGAKQVMDIAGEEWVKRFAMETTEAFLNALPAGIDIDDAAYLPIKEKVIGLSAEFAIKGISPTNTAKLVFSSKDAFLATLQGGYQKEKLNEAILLVNQLIDKLGLLTFETFVKVREESIKEQQKSLIELSAPVIKVWDKIVMVPLIGILDSQRTQLVMEKLLEAVENTQSKVCILDISGIPLVDSAVARHLIRTATAAKLMGAECIITGISSRIAQTITQLGIDLSGLITKSSMVDGLKVAFDLVGQKVASK